MFPIKAGKIIETIVGKIKKITTFVCCISKKKL
jgi:hypothetical protein